MPALSVIDLAMFVLDPPAGFRGNFADKCQLGFLALPKAVPHVERLAAYTVDALEERKQATAAKAAPRVPPNRRPHAGAAKP